MLWREEENIRSFQICAWFSPRKAPASGRCTPSAVLTLSSLACQFACQVHRRENHSRTGHSGCGVCFARMDQTASGSKCFSKVENAGILWLE